ncbi:hypothetical protein GCK72_007974 [Caenorhabditis remanei]|uniref:Uncharacterized protein n=1 Tax=Caenorhabditis remanei TaxID=31234 RepID=A0A6A5HNU3_CAERE|nr:hypothetical protein GCK72_007974 [Caenorhabditis remanei]KAF1768013.1 hypothetical protein GCK72_007974 [Caenorhabditis remanei]
MPLTYLSSKSVLQFIDPNLRIEFRQRCPGIRSTEKSIPMRIDEVQLTPTMIRINKKTYRLCLYECYREDSDLTVDKMPEGIRNVRKMSRERDHDVDHYGIRDQPEATIRFVERLRQDLDIEHSKDMYYKAKQLLSIETNPVEMKALEERINHYGSIYYPYLLREKETPRYRMPYFYFIKLVAGERTEVVQYSKTLGDALKYLLKKIFVDNLVIRTLEIKPTAPFYYSIPYNLSVCNLKITQQTSTALNAFFFSSPLQKLEILAHPREIVDYSNPTLKDARIVVSTGVVTREHVESFINRRVIFSNPIGDFSVLDVLPCLVKKWISVTPNIGTHFSFSHRDCCSADWLMRGVGRVDGARKCRIPEGRNSDCRVYITIELSNEESEINVFYEGDDIHVKVYQKGHAMSVEMDNVLQLNQ